MPAEQKSFPTRWILLILILVGQALVLVIAPEERTLGWGIKPVYLHVSLTWTGMLLLGLNGLLGLAILVRPAWQLVVWQRRLLLAALWFYATGFAISMYASWLNWGGIPFQEPRVQAAINVLVAGIAAWALRELLNNPRAKALAGMIPLAFMLLGGRSPRMVLHPDNPVVSSPLGIKSTFVGMFILAILLAVWFLWRPERPAGAPANTD